MNNKFLLLLLCPFCFLNAQRDLTLPPGTIALNDSLFIDKSPVTNRMFNEYLTVKNVLKNKGYSSFSQYVVEDKITGFPDEMREFYYPSPFLIDLYSNITNLTRNGYHKDPKYKNHPVLNISTEQAMDYCRWRTEMVQHLWTYDATHAAKKNLATKINYRLITKDELIRAKQNLSNSKKINEFKANLLKIKIQKEVTQFSIFPINEMTTTEEVVFEVSDFEYSGFRCVCETKSK